MLDRIRRLEGHVEILTGRVSQFEHEAARRNADRASQSLGTDRASQSPSANAGSSGQEKSKTLHVNGSR